MEVGEDDESEEDDADHHHLLEEDGESTEIKRLGFILGAAEDIRLVPQEEVDRLNNCPRAHWSRDTSLLSEL